MSLLPWRIKREGVPGEMSPMFALRSEVDRLFDSYLREPLSSLDLSSWGSGKWSPAVDVGETDNEITVRAELPGIDPKDLDISVVGNKLIIRGEKKETTETDEKGFHQCETRYGSFHRSIPLPDGVDTENVDAQYANGVLTLRMPKTPQAATKRIEVKVK